jgi:hypothetical protein
LPHQAGFFTSTSFTSCSQLFNMKGPVPLAFRWAKFSSLVLMSLGSVDLFFSAQSLSIMRSSVICRSSTGFGPLVKTSIVSSSTLTMRSMPCV